MDFPGIGFASLLLISLLQCRSTYSFCRWLFNSRRWHYYCGISESVFARERGRIWWDGCRCRCRCSQVSYFYLVYVVAARLLNIRHHKYLRFWVTIFFSFPFNLISVGVCRLKIVVAWYPIYSVLAVEARNQHHSSRISNRTRHLPDRNWATGAWYRSMTYPNSSLRLIVRPRSFSN